MYNMSIFKKSNSWTIDEAHEKELNIKSLKYNEVNVEATFEGSPNYSKTTSKLTSLCPNLIISSSFLETSSIVQLFDFLTSNINLC